MEPQPHIPPAASTLGTIGTILWCIQIIPQIWHNWRSHSTEGLPGIMFFIWAICNVPFGAYVIIQNFNIPIQIQPQALAFFALICFGQTLYYGRRWSALRASLTTIALGVTFAGAELALVLLLRPIYFRGGMDAPLYALGISSQVLYVVGLLPPYFELWKRGGRVIGFNFLFLGLDISGAFFSLLSIGLQPKFDLLGALCYIFVLVMEIGICTSHAIWLLRTRQSRKQAYLVQKDVESDACSSVEPTKCDGH